MRTGDRVPDNPKTHCKLKHQRCERFVVNLEHPFVVRSLFLVFIHCMALLQRFGQISTGVWVKYLYIKKDIVLPDFKDQCNVTFHCIASCTLEHFYLECSAIFSLVFYGVYLVMQLVEIQVERSTLKCNIQKSIPRSYNYVMLNIMLPSRIEICSFDMKF